MADLSAPRLACPSCHGLWLRIAYTDSAGDNELFICGRCGDMNTFAEWKRETRERALAFVATVRELEEEARG